MNRKTSLLAVAAIGLTASACRETPTAKRDHDFSAREIGLRAFDDCDTLLAYYQSEAIADLERMGDFGQGFGRAIPLSGAEDTSDPAAQPQAPGEASNGAAEQSGTNVQERGVDEPDLVKTDGEYVYVVRNGQLLIYGKADLSLVGALPFTGDPHALFIDGDRALVLGNAYDAPVGFEVPEHQRYASRVVLSIVDLSNRAAPSLLRETIVDGTLIDARLTGHTARIVIHHSPILAPVDFAQGGGIEPGGVPVDGGGSSSGGSSTGTSPGSSDEPSMATPAEPPVDEAASPLAREIADDSGEPVDYLALMTAAIRETRIDDWLPQSRTRAGEVIGTSRTVACENVSRPGERSGSETTVILSIDLRNPDRVMNDPGVVTSTQGIYATGDALFIATTNWRDVFFAGGGDVVVGIGVAEPGRQTEPADAPAESPPAEPTDEVPMAQVAEESADGEVIDNREATQLHRLALPGDGLPAVYEASGRVHGRPLNAFSFDLHEGHLRVATTEHPMGEGTIETNETRVFVLDDGLEVSGRTSPLAPGEDIFAVRLEGDHGFVVTFEQKDPLFTIDLSTPSAPDVVGELSVTGYSTYLQVLDESHLLGVGVAADEQGFQLGLQVSIFDISNFASPELAHRLEIGGAYSDANYNHHALTLWGDRLLLPINAYSEAGHVDGLQVLRVDTEDGIAELGLISHDDLVPGDDYPHVERSVIIGDGIYSVSTVGIIASGMEALEERAHAVFPSDPAPSGGGGGGFIEGGPTGIGREGEPTEPAPSEDAPQ